MWLLGPYLSSAPEPAPSIAVAQRVYAVKCGLQRRDATLARLWTRYAVRWAGCSSSLAWRSLLASV